MNLLKIYMKLLFIKNRISYLFIVLSIIVTYIVTSITMIYTENVLILNSEPTFSNMHYISISIRTVFIIAGITFVVSQYFNNMKSSVRDYNILRGLGATKKNIRCFIYVQMIFLIIISIPIGLLSGNLLAGLLIRCVGTISLNENVLEWMASATTFYILAGVILFIIIIIGVFLEREITKSPLANIFSDNL